jgi:hypothetical protein
MKKIVRKNGFWVIENPESKWTNWKAYIDPDAKMCGECGQEQIREDQKICYSCYQLITGLREIKEDEIVIDIDDRSKHGLECYLETALRLAHAGYYIEIYYAEGMKQPHVHIKKIEGMKELSPDVRKNYKKLFTEKYILQKFWNDKIPDSSLYGKHLIANENRPHHKYKTIKKLVAEYNVGNENKVEKDLVIRSRTYNHVQPTHKYSSEELAKGKFLFQKIASKLRISYIADCFGLEPKGTLKRVCPFHADTKPSLSLSDDKGTFNCFGCNLSGNIILFYALLKQINPSFKIGGNQWNLK